MPRSSTGAQISGGTRPATLQAKWINTSERHWTWDALIGGLLWHYQEPLKKNSDGVMSFEIKERHEDKDIQNILAELRKSSHTYNEWLKIWTDLGWHPQRSTREHPRQFSQYVNRIVTTYPPEQHIYVGVGASCDLIFEYLRLVRPDVKLTGIPISQANALPEDNGGKWTSGQLGNLDSYVAKTVGEAAINDTKMNLVVMDVTSGGMSLANISDALIRVLEKRNKGPGRVQRLSLNTTLAADATLKVPKSADGSKTSGLMESDMRERPLTPEERLRGMVKRGAVWKGIEEFDDSELEEPAKEEPDKEEPAAAKEQSPEVVKKPGKWSLKSAEGAESSDEEPDSPDKGPELSKMHTEYDPSGYDMLLTTAGDAASRIGKKLDDMDYKSMGRIYEKIPMKQVMSGVISDPAAYYDKGGHESVKSYAKLLRDGV